MATIIKNKVGAPKGSRNSVKTEFKKGATAWNKGTKGIMVAWNKGKKGLVIVSDETRKKLSIARKGRKMGPMSEATKYKISESKKGTKMSDEAKRKMGEARRGEKNWRWIADRTKLAVLKNGEEYRNSPANREWGQQVKNRDGWKCQISNDDCSGKVVAHHILPWSKFPELRYEVKNGITLCHFHHPRKRNDEIRLAPYFQELVKVK